MKVVHVFKDAYPPLVAGITRYIHDTAAAASLRGADVTVIVAGVRSGRVDQMPGGTTIVRCREWGRVLSMPMSPALVRTVRSTPADVVHVHMPNPIGELGALLGRHRLVVSMHAQLGRQRALESVYAPLRDAVLRRATDILVASEPMAMISELAAFAAKVSVVPYGVSPGVVSDAPPSPSDGFRALFVGRLVYYKGLDVLLEAMRLVPDASLTIVGEGPMRSEVERGVAEFGGRVMLAGRLSDGDLAAAYATHDVLVLPSVSRAEAFGLSAAEAMANGVPVISTALGTGTDWMNVDGVTGLVVAPGDAGELAGALNRLASDPQLRNALGVAARARARETFSFERHMDALWAIYVRAAGRG